MAEVNWSEVVEEYYPKIYRYTYQFFGNRAEAEDVTQDTFLKAYLSLDSLNDPKAIKHWLYSIARNKSIDRKRWWKRTAHLIARHFDPETSLTFNNQYISQDLSLSIRKVVAELPLKQREVFILRHWHDFSTEETAQVLGLSPGTIKSHLQRAVQKVKAALLEEPSSAHMTTDLSSETSKSAREKP